MVSSTSGEASSFTEYKGIVIGCPWRLLSDLNQECEACKWSLCGRQLVVDRKIAHEYLNFARNMLSRQHLLSLIDEEVQRSSGSQRTRMTDLPKPSPSSAPLTAARRPEPRAALSAAYTKEGPPLPGFAPPATLIKPIMDDSLPLERINYTLPSALLTHPTSPANLLKSSKVRFSLLLLIGHLKCIKRPNFSEPAKR